MQFSSEFSLVSHLYVNPLLQA